MSTTLYINKPGGVIAKLADGTGKSFKYGDPVSADMFAEHVNVGEFADPRQRVAVESQELEAHRRAALTENGQVNSSSSAVPGNYSELDEDGAAQLMSNLARYPEMQAAILKHEILFGGNRQKVMDSASEGARVSVGLQLGAIPQNASVKGDVSGAPVAAPPDPDQGGWTRDDQANAEKINQHAVDQLRMRTPPPMTADEDDGEDAELEALRARLTEAENAMAASAARTNDGESNGDPEVAGSTGWDDFEYGDLKSYIDQHELPVAKNQSTEKLIEGIRGVEGHDTPQTPPASKTA